MTTPRDNYDRSHIRAQLLRLMGEVLGETLPPIPDDTPILDFVPSSLALVEGMRRVYEHFGVLISIRRVLEGHATLGAITAYIEQELSRQPARALEAANAAADAKLPPARRVALAPSQHHVGILTRYSPEAASAFSESLAVRLDGPLDGPALQAAVEAVAERYEALHTALSPDRDELMVQPGRTLEMAVTACSEAEVERKLLALLDRPFAPGERLFRVELLRVVEGYHLLVLVSHALVVEIEALQIVLAELGEFYAAYAQNGDPAQGFPALQWTDYLAMGQAAPAVAARAAAEAYWRPRLDAAWPRLELPGDYPRPPVKQYAGARVALPLDKSLTDGLTVWAQANGLTANDVITGAWALCLGRLAGQPDLVVGVRSAPLYLDAGERVVAPTRTMLPVRVSLDRQQSFLAYVREAAADQASANHNRHLSLAEMIKLQKQGRDQSRSALFTAAVQARALGEAPAFGALTTAYAPLPASRTRYDLELIVAAEPDGTRLVGDYSTELFQAETITRWLRGFVALLEAGLAQPETPCARLPMLPADERQRMLVEWNSNARPYPKDRTALDLFVAQARVSPDASAVRCEDDVWSYRQLLTRVEALAAQLAGQGVVPGDRVGLLLERSPDLLAALLATWRAGALYVPLDHALPAKRLAYMLDDAGVRVVVTSQALKPRLPDGFDGRVLAVDDEPAAPAGQPQAARAADSAYIIYTSGSTGQPKGVEVGHQSLVNCLLAVRDYLDFGAGDTLLAITTVSFDISTVELFMPLAVGGVVDIAPDGVVADGLRLAQMIAAHAPTYMQATPSIWKMIIGAGWQGQKDLILGTAGENLSRALADQLLSRGKALWNLYGPTEATVYSTGGQVEAGTAPSVSIGRPLANTQAYILDDYLQPVPLGAVGELYVGGDCLACGYWGRPALTAERFVASPFAPGERLYRTGDLARYRAEGDILCLGRIDDQLKIHGVRVELGEVEAALRNVTGVRDAVVTAWKDARGDTQLVGHIIPAQQPAPATADIRAQLREQLPEVMIPPYLLFTEAFPQTSTGKVRRAALPTPDTARSSLAAALAPPETPTERQLAAAWATVLGLAEGQIGRDADFMDLGGHSLLMTPLMLEIRQRFQVSFSLREFFDAPTLRTFAALIDARRQAAASHQPDTRPARTAEWGRQRMAFLLREADLPPTLTPARGARYQPGGAYEKVLLTGGTGFLGAYLIAEILDTTEAQVYCLVRPKRGEEGKARIERQMRHYAVWRDDERWLTNWRARLHVVDGDVTLPRMGLADTTYENLAREIDAVLHGAAHVNFIYPYEALRGTNVLGIHEIIRFAFDTRIKPVHHLSTAAIWPMGAQHTFYEKDPIEHGQVLNLGYDEAKWVGERCLLNAQERGLPVARYRPGEVGGDSVTGRCVTDHFLIASIKGFLQFGAFPDLDIKVDVAPVDYVAKAMIHLMFKRNALGRAFHLTNPQRRHMRDALGFLRGLGYQFEELRFEELRDRLVNSRHFASNALFAYQATLEDMDDTSLQLPTYDTRQTQRELRHAGIACPPADEKLFSLYIRYLQDVNFLPLPEHVAVF